MTRPCTVVLIGCYCSGLAPRLLCTKPHLLTYLLTQLTDVVWLIGCDSEVVSRPDSQSGCTAFDSRQRSTCSGLAKHKLYSLRVNELVPSFDWMGLMDP